MKENFSFGSEYVPKMPKHALPHPYQPPRPDRAFAKKYFKREKYPLSDSERTVYEWLLNPQNKFALGRREKKLTMSDLDDFVGIDGQDVVRDKQKVRERKREEKDGTERGFIFEELSRTVFTQNEWFGEMESSASSDYDDRFNGVDFILNSDEPDGRTIYLAVDCTVTDSVSNLQKKIYQTQDNLRNDKLTSVKYYQSSYYDSEHIPESEKGNHLKTLKNVPRVVVAIPSEVLDYLCNLTMGVIEKEPGANEVIAKDFHQFLFLLQIEAQLRKQSELLKEVKEVEVEKELGLSKRARSIGHETEIQDIVAQALSKVESMLEDKRKDLGEEKYEKAKKLFEECGYSSLMR